MDKSFVEKEDMIILIGAITALLFLSLVIGISVFYCRRTKKKSAKNVAITTLKVEEYGFDECTNEESRGSCGDDYQLPPLETDYLSKDPYFPSRKDVFCGYVRLLLSSKWII